MIIENETPCTGATIRLRPQVRKDVLTGLGLVLIGAALGVGMFGWSMFTIGWEASTLYRTLQPYITERGSYALLTICFATPVVLIWRGNHKIAGTWPKDWI